MSNKSDEEIVKQVVQGDSEIFGVLVRRYQEKIFRLAYGYTGNEDDAMELAQDILIASFESLPRFRGESKFSTWLYSIGMNHCKNFIRKRGRIISMPIKSIVDDSELEIQLADKKTDVEQSVINNDSMKIAVDELGKLPVEYREAVLLRDLNGMSYDEISIALGITMSNVKVRIHRGRDMLKKRLIERGLI